jgi:hypothetical protein
MCGRAARPGAGAKPATAAIERCAGAILFPPPLKLRKSTQFGEAGIEVKHVDDNLCGARDVR